MAVSANEPGPGNEHRQVRRELVPTDKRRADLTRFRQRYSSDGGAWRSGSRLKQTSAIFTCTDADSENELRVVRRWLMRRGLDTWVTDDPSTVVAVALLETEPIDLSRLPCLPRDTTSASAVLTRQIGSTAVRERRYLVQRGRHGRSGLGW